MRVGWQRKAAAGIRIRQSMEPQRVQSVNVCMYLCHAKLVVLRHIPRSSRAILIGFSLFCLRQAMPLKFLAFALLPSCGFVGSHVLTPSLLFYSLSFFLLLGFIISPLLNYIQLSTYSGLRICDSWYINLYFTYLFFSYEKLDHFSSFSTSFILRAMICGT